jgi:hypothetical protein
MGWREESSLFLGEEVMLARSLLDTEISHKSFSKHVGLVSLGIVDTDVEEFATLVGETPKTP